MISEGETCLVSMQILKSCSTESLVQRIAEDRGITTPLLPGRCVQYARNQSTGRSVYVLQWDPRTQRMEYRIGNEHRAATIHLPWTVELHCLTGPAYDSYYLFGRGEPLGYGDAPLELKFIPVGNLYHDGRACLGGSFRFSLNMPVNEKIAETSVHFWGSSANMDLHSIQIGMLPEGLTLPPGVQDVWREWSTRLTEPCEAKWKSAGTLDEIVARLLRRGE